VTNQDDGAGSAGSQGSRNPNMMATVWDSGPAQPAASLGPGESFAGRYEIQKELGAGGMGVVYLARDSITQEAVALKLIHPSLLDSTARDRMIAEGVNTRRIRNPHVVAVYDVGEHDGQVFLSMEHIEGRPLRAWMAENMASGLDAPLADVLLITQEILSGLAAAHGEGVVHRDLKPENIMISGSPSDADFKLKVLDFGIARGLKTEAFTGSAAAIGTPLYMAPEQKTTPDQAGPPADIYSVGRMLYEMLMDVLPDGAWNPPSESRNDVPPALDAVIRKALQAPKHRYQTVAEFSAAIDAAVQGTKAAEVSKVVWRSEGGDKLLSNLRSLDATINERVADGVSWLNENLKRGPASPPGQGTAPEPEPQTDRRGDPGPAEPANKAKSATKRNLLIGGGAVVALGLVGAVLDQQEAEPPWPPEPDPDPDPNPEPDPDPDPDTRFPDVEGAWRMEGGSTFDVTQSGSFIEGTGQSGSWGVVRFTGPIDGPIEIFSETYGQPVGLMQGGLGPRGGGIAGFDWRGTMTDLTTGAQYQILFHINH